MARLWSCFGVERGRIFLVFGLVVLDCAILLSGPWLIGRCVDAMVPGPLSASIAFAALLGDPPPRLRPGRRARRGPGLAHGRGLAGDREVPEEGPLRKTPAPSRLPLRYLEPRRPHEPPVERRGQHLEHDSPIDDPARLHPSHDSRLPRPHDRPFAPPDPRGPGHRALCIPPDPDRLAAHPRPLQAAAGRARSPQRPNRGDHLGPGRREGLRQGRRCDRRVRRPQRGAKIRRDSGAGLVGLHHAPHERHQQPGLCCGGRRGRRPRRQGPRHRRRHRELHLLLAPVLEAPQRSRQHLQYAADGPRGRRARLRDNGPGRRGAG